LILAGCAHVPSQSRHFADSFDNVPISYSEYGKGDITLVFIHGWSCDSRYWDNQVPYFSPKYRVITIDLAGHGHSGLSREDYSMESFGKDIKAVVEKSGAKRVILIGHSMSGDIAAYTVRMLPGKIIGIIGIDTLHNVGLKYTQKEYDEFIKPFDADFVKQTDTFVRGMFPKSADPAIVSWVASDLCATYRPMAKSALRSYLGIYLSGEPAKLFDGIKVPVLAVNSDLWPTDIVSNRRHIPLFDAQIMKGAGHFPMLERPAEFNRLLDKTIGKIVK